MLLVLNPGMERLLLVSELLRTLSSVLFPRCCFLEDYYGELHVLYYRLLLAS